MKIDGQIVEVGCGRCQYQMEGVEACFWAAQIDGEHYVIRGSVPYAHNKHARDGICNMTRQARIDGELRGDVLIASELELLPAQSIPETPRFGPDEEH